MYNLHLQGIVLSRFDPLFYGHGIIQFEIETGLAPVYNAFDKVDVQMTSYVGNVNLYYIFTRHEYTDLTRHKIIIAQILTI